MPPFSHGFGQILSATVLWKAGQPEPEAAGT